MSRAHQGPDREIPVILPSTPALTRRRFLETLSAAIPLWRLASAPGPATPLVLVQGARGIWGVTTDVRPDAASFGRGPRGIVGLQRAPGGIPPTRDERGVLGLASS